MAGLQRAHRRIDDFEDDILDDAPDPAAAWVQDNGPTAVRPRIGASPRARPQRRSRRSDGTTLWRVLGVSAAVLILGSGGLFALHLVAPGNVKPAPQPVQISGPLHPRLSAKVASILGHPGGVADPAPVNAMAASVAAPDTAPPTPADFARPAFLEPMETDEQALPEAAAMTDGPDGTVAEAPPPAQAAPLPAARPRDIALASGDAAAGDASTKDSASKDTAPKTADTRTARISMDVTLRSGPRRSASALGTLDEGTRVTLYSCKSWCEVATGDKRGYVYRSAVDR
ncbi:SH3 domain-containing protein [Xanthobacter sp. AM11]|uniref:SH3 domain-containing protein n=1 Tax=Xanthobacter sp. AM11 TaxID=3380643 RepID=UPI0039BFB07A